MPTKGLPSLKQAIPVMPLPMKGSHTVWSASLRQSKWICARLQGCPLDGQWMGFGGGAADGDGATGHPGDRGAEPEGEFVAAHGTAEIVGHHVGKLQGAEKG